MAMEHEVGAMSWSKKLSQEVRARIYRKELNQRAGGTS